MSIELTVVDTEKVGISRYLIMKGLFVYIYLVIITFTPGNSHLIVS